MWSLLGSNLFRARTLILKFILKSTQSSVPLKQHLEICETILFPLVSEQQIWPLCKALTCTRLDLTWRDWMVLNLVNCKLVKIMEWKLILQRHVEHYHSSLNSFSGICCHDIYNAPNQSQDFWIRNHFLLKAGIFSKVGGHSGHTSSFVNICPSYSAQVRIIW